MYSGQGKINLQIISETFEGERRIELNMKLPLKHFSSCDCRLMMYILNGTTKEKMEQQRRKWNNKEENRATKENMQTQRRT